MSCPIPCRRSWWILVLLTFGTSAVAREPWAAQAAECLQTLDGFNEDREWAQVRITPDEEVRVLVQSGGEDWVFVELVCQPGGGLAEGPRRTLPPRVTGTGAVPVAMLVRRDFSAERLEGLVERARQYADLGHSALVELDASYVNDPRPRTVFRAVVARDGTRRTVEFDDSGMIQGQLALRPDEVGDAPDAPAPGAALGLERLIADPVKVATYLAGVLGPGTRINRFIVDPSMLTVEWVAPREAKILLGQWMVIDGNITTTGDPSPPNIDKVCARQPTIDAVKDSLRRLMAQPERSKRIRQAAMLLLECESAGTPPSWNLLGGDGKLEAGVPLSQEQFAL